MGTSNRTEIKESSTVNPDRRKKREENTKDTWRMKQKQRIKAESNQEEGCLEERLKHQQAF